MTWLLLVISAAWAERVPGRYVVELSGESVLEHVVRAKSKGGVRSADAVERRSAVRAEQQRLRGRLEQRNVRVLDSVDTVANAMMVSVSDAEAEQLKLVAGVKRVLPVRTKQMIMDRAVVLQRVREAWNRVGEEQAGAGAKIAIIDSGVDANHMALRDASMKAPDGYPRAGSDADLANTSGKVIVARSYVNLLPRRDSDTTARDHVGHGTALAVVAAGVRTAAPLGTIEGIAPKAYLGNYKVFGSPGINDSTTDDAILKAMDDAVADGMDVINLSLGGDLAPRLEEDISVIAVERATKAGVMVVVAAGNNGPNLNTMASPGTAPSAITVGAVTSDRTFAASVAAEGLGSYVGVLGDGASPQVAVSGDLVDVAAGSADTLACAAMPASSLTGKVALIERGNCTFQIKLQNVLQAGAIAAVVYAPANSPAPISMAVGNVTLPALMVSHEAGAAMRARLAEQAGLQVTMHFTRQAVSMPAGLITDFSAAGPNVDLSIKPDLVAVGGDVYTGSQTLNPAGDMYSANGFIVVDGTSFSAPMVSGAAALVKSARPGLTVDQYRSLVIHSAKALSGLDGSPLPLQQTGAGELDVEASLEAKVTATPVTLGFGAGSADADLRKTLTVANVGAEAGTFLIAAETRAGAAALRFERSTVELGAGASAEFGVELQANGLAAGTHEGFVTLTNVSTGAAIRVPYWYAVRTNEPANIAILDQVASARRGSMRRDAVLLRVTESSGVAMADASIEVTALSGGGAGVEVVSYDSEIPGLYGITVQLGPTAGANVFRIQAGNVSTLVTITGQ
ncbi:MAG: S8 family serine peptidase [Bryobacterales bacterium]|nr:S8 family serine peptidase [Bryobacterales bacterium]